MSLLLFLFFLLPYTSAALSYPYNYTLRINSGSQVNSTDVFHNNWVSDQYFSGGLSGIVSEPLHFVHDQEKTLRYFPISYGKKNCYSIPTGIAGGTRYFLRTFSVYDNFDGKSHSPSFDVSVDSTLVFSWRSPWPEAVSGAGAYADLFIYDDDGVVEVCFYSIATDSPVVGSLELVQIEPKAYNFTYPRNFSSYIMVNYGRFSSWPDQWGPGFSNDTDYFGRSWQSDMEFRVKSSLIANGVMIKPVTTNKTVANVETSPNYFPGRLYQTAITAQGNDGGGGVLEYELSVDAKLDYLLWFHFAEIDSSVTKPGQRVFDLLVNGVKMDRVDVYKEVGGFTAYDLNYVIKNLSASPLIVRLESVVGAPFICGLENYAIVPVDPKTIPEQVTAMKALKDSLRVPDRMGWNGDPCAPSTWDAWEGVTCHPIKDGSDLVITQIDLGSQGLKGYISDKIGLLTNLVSLNLSSNSLGGDIPPGLGLKSLVKLDLSNNKFTGYIPDGLTSSSLQLVLLNGNSLEGEVPEELYSVGVRGGKIDLSLNKGLCGVPSLPSCSLLWDKHGLSTGGKVAIGIACLVIFSALLFGILYYIKKRQDDYDFGLPHELTSLAAKRNRYHRQKSLMTLEMESQHAKGFIPTYNVS